MQGGGKRPLTQVEKNKCNMNTESFRLKQIRKVQVDPLKKE